MPGCKLFWNFPPTDLTVVDLNFDKDNRHLEYETGSEEELSRMIEEGEHLKQDFKFRIDSSAKIAKTLSAFANTAGGKLLIGVKDNGKVTGVDPEEEYFMIEGAASVYCQPEVPFEAQVFLGDEGQRVLVISIPLSDERPHYVKASAQQRRQAFLRQADENYAANSVMLRFLRDHSKNEARKNLVAYGPAERALFDYLAGHEEVSISKFSRLAKVPYKKAEKIMAAFLKWGVVQWRASDQGIRFSLNPDHNSEI